MTFWEQPRSWLVGKRKLRGKSFLNWRAAEFKRIAESQFRGKPIQKIRNGFEILPAGDRVVTPELVQKILEESSEA